MLLIKLAFEAVQHVVDFGEAGLFQCAAGVERTVAAAADQHYRTIDAGGFFYMCHKIGINVPVRPVVPRNVNCACRMTDEQVFHLAAAVDEHGLRMLLEELLRLGGFQVFHLVLVRSAACRPPAPLGGHAARPVGGGTARC